MDMPQTQLSSGKPAQAAVHLPEEVHELPFVREMVGV